MDLSSINLFIPLLDPSLHPPAMNSTLDYSNASFSAWLCSWNHSTKWNSFIRGIHNIALMGVCSQCCHFITYEWNMRQQLGEVATTNWLALLGSCVGTSLESSQGHFPCQGFLPGELQLPSLSVLHPTVVLALENIRVGGQDHLVLLQHGCNLMTFFKWLKISLKWHWWPWVGLVST